MTLANIARLLRPEQWVKNAFVVVPLFFTPTLLTRANAIAVLIGVACFSAIASAVYILNDFRDRDSDRLHPRKKSRPLAAGTVSLPVAFGLVALLVAGGLGVAQLHLAPAFFNILAFYLLMNVAYTWGLKSVSIVDVMIIALGFVLRVEGGAYLIGVAATSWLVIATGLLALFLALAKRRDDLSQGLDSAHRKSIAGYTKPFLDSAISIMLGALLVVYLIYVTTGGGPAKAFYTTPFVVVGILRYLQITIVEERSGSPTRILLTDRMIVASVGGWLLCYAALLYA